MELLQIVNNWLKIVQYWLGRCLRLPVHCLLCLSDSSAIICNHCEGNLPWLGVQNSEIRALFAYRPPLEGFVVGLKFKQALHFADWFAHIMIKMWGRPDVDLVIPLPLHPSRQQERGFNQTLEIARVLATHWNIPLDRWSCTRVKYRTPQSRLSASLRKLNLTPSSFHVAPALKGKRVLVIEDVITTGATINAFVLALKQAGVKQVLVWACCQTLMH